MSIIEHTSGKKITGTVKELLGIVSALAALMVALCTLAGVVGAMYVGNYRIGQSEVSISMLSSRIEERDRQANERWVQLAKLQASVEGIDKKTDRIETKLDLASRNIP